MSNNIINLYGNYKTQPDRRQQNVPVAVERRSGMDRRQNTRLTIDTKLQKDIDKTKDTFQAFIRQPENNPNATVLSAVPPLDNVEEIHDSIKKQDYFRAGIATALMVNSLPADLKELSNAAKDLFDIPIPEERLVPEGYQVKASFFRGTLLEPILRIPFLGKKLYDWDKSMFDSSFGNWLLSKFEELNIDTKETQIPDKVIGGFIPSIKFNGNQLACFIGYSLMKISKINLVTLALLQVSPIVRAFKSKDMTKNNRKSGFLQTIKSCINITLGVLGGVILGTLFRKKGAASSLLALGFGSYAGSKAGEYIGEKIDKG